MVALLLLASLPFVSHASATSLLRKFTCALIATSSRVLSMLPLIAIAHGIIIVGCLKAAQAIYSCSLPHGFNPLPSSLPSCPPQVNIGQQTMTGFGYGQPIRGLASTSPSRAGPALRRSGCKDRCHERYQLLDGILLASAAPLAAMLHHTPSTPVAIQKGYKNGHLESIRVAAGRQV